MKTLSIAKGNLILLFLLVSFFGFSQDSTATYKFKYFELEYNFTKKSPTWIKYQLTDSMALNKKKYRRIGFFKPKGLPTASNANYRKSGFDRGHCFPFAHADFDKVGANESMSYLNMTAQRPFINRTVIKAMESYERKVAIKFGCINVRLENLFKGDTLRGMAIPYKFLRRISKCNGELIEENSYLNL